MKSLAKGFRVEASILARVLGIKLLKLDASVLVMPAELGEAAGPVRGIVNRKPRRLDSDERSMYPTGRNLADAVRSMNEGAEFLEEARRNGV